MSVCLMLLNFNDSVLTLFHLRRVPPHLQADENFDVAGVAAGFGGADTALAKGGWEFRPLRSSSPRALVSSERHCRKLSSKLKLLPIFAAARQPASTSRVGTASATRSVPP